MWQRFNISDFKPTIVQTIAGARISFKSHKGFTSYKSFCILCVRISGVAAVQLEWEGWSSFVSCMKDDINFALNFLLRELSLSKKNVDSSKPDRAFFKRKFKLPFDLFSQKRTLSLIGFCIFILFQSKILTLK